MSFYPEPDVYSWNKITVCLSYYARKSDLKEAKGFNTSKFAAKGDLPSLKLDVHELEIDKLKIITMKNYITWFTWIIWNSEL